MHFRGAERARESTVSTDNVAVVKNEVAPLRPDLVVYYEGGNQFELNFDRRQGARRKSAARQAPPATAAPGWLQAATRYSAIARPRLFFRAAVGMTGPRRTAANGPSPTTSLQWPRGYSELDPDLAYPRLPVNLNLIQRDLDAMRTAVQHVGSDFAVSSFLWMVKDGTGARPGPPQVHPRAAQQWLLPVPLSRHGTAGDLPEPAARQVRKERHDYPVHRHGLLFSARSRPVRRCRRTPTTPASGCRPGSPSICCCRWSKSTWPTARGLRPTDPAAPALPTITPRKVTFTCQ